MFRTISLSIPSNKTEEILKQISVRDGLLGMRVLRGSSVRPEGDSIFLDVKTDALNDFVSMFDEHGIGHSFSSSIATSEPLSFLSPDTMDSIYEEKNEITCEELEEILTHEGNMSWNMLLVMSLAGIIATIGIINDALHLVIGAMIIAPGFEPAATVASGLVFKGRQETKRAIVSIMKGYAVMVFSSGIAAFFMLNEGSPDSTSYLTKGVLTQYWANITPSSFFIAVAASVAGGVLIITNRSTLTAGVMVALALIPSSALMGISAYKGDWPVFMQSFLRLILELSLITVCCVSVFLYKKKKVHRRESIRRNSR